MLIIRDVGSRTAGAAPRRYRRIGVERLAKVAYEQMRGLGYYQIYRSHSHGPAIELAENGFPVGERCAYYWQWYLDRQGRFTDMSQLMVDGRAPHAGSGSISGITQTVRNLGASVGLAAAPLRIAARRTPS